MLQRRHVLILVDRQPANRRADRGGQLLVIIHDMAHEQQNVIEIDLSADRLLPLVRRDDVGETLRIELRRRLTVRRRAHARIVVGRHQRHLRPVDLRPDVTHLLRIDVRGIGDPSDRPLHVLALVGGHVRQRRLEDVVPHTPQLLQCRRMERRSGHVVADPQRLQPRAHLRGRLHRERHGEHLAGIPIPPRARIGDATGHRAGLARSGPRDDAHRAVQRGNGRHLRIVQPLKNRLARCTHILHCGACPADALPA